MIVTTTPNVEGYTITKYLDTVTGASIYLLGGVIGEGMFSKRQSSQFAFAWQEAVGFMSKAAGNADAVVGVQHTLCGVANGYMVVTVTGTAVKLAEDPVHKMQAEQAKQQAERIRQEEQQRELEKKKDAEEKQRHYLETHEIEYAINPNGEQAVFPIPCDKPDTVLCPQCGERQRSGRYKCMKCGIPFMFEA